jgi:hypothetical protein
MCEFMTIGQSELNGVTGDRQQEIHHFVATHFYADSMIVAVGNSLIARSGQ